MPGTVTVKAGTIDFNGHVVSNKDDESAKRAYVLTVAKNGAVTLTDSQATGDDANARTAGVVVTTTSTYRTSPVQTEEGASLTLNKVKIACSYGASNAGTGVYARGTLEITGSLIDTAGTAVDERGASGKVTVSGSVIKAGRSRDGIDIGRDFVGDVSVSGTMITAHEEGQNGSKGIQAWSEGNLKLSNTTINSFGTGIDASYSGTSTPLYTTIDNCQVTAESGPAILTNSIRTTVNGGTYTSKSAAAVSTFGGKLVVNDGVFDASSAKNAVSATSSNPTATVNGGWYKSQGKPFNFKPTVKSGYALTTAPLTEGDHVGYYGLVEAGQEGEQPAVASVDGIEYADLAEALASMDASSTVTLLSDIDADEPLELKAGRLDLNGHALELSQYTGSLKVTGDARVHDSAGGGKIEAPSRVSAVDVSGSFMLDSGTITMGTGSNNTPIMVRSGATVTVRGGTIEGRIDVSEGNCTVNIQGGTLRGVTETAARGNATYGDNVTLAMSGGLSRTIGAPASCSKARTLR